MFVLVPEGRRKLASGGTAGRRRKHPTSPGGATDRGQSVAPLGLAVSTHSIPVVTLRSTTG